MVVAHGRTAASGFAQLCAWGQRCSVVPVWAVVPFADRRFLARASFLLAVGCQSAELLFGGPPLGSDGGGMSARSGGSWSTGGEGKLGPTTDPLGHNS
jgi:hypothetical protein